MPKNPGKRPAKYVIVRNHLLELIRNGLASGSPVPSERELCEQFEVSRMTVRQAIDTLVVDGILERHQGKGTFVAPPKLDLQVRLTSFTQEMRRRGMEPGVVMLQAETIASDETVAEALELEAGAEVHHLRRLLTANAIPMAIEENWIPAALLPNLLRTSPNFSVYAELTQAGLTPQWGEDMIEAHAASAQEAALLSIQAALGLAGIGLCKLNTSGYFLTLALLALGVAYMLVPVYLTWRRPAASLGRAAYSQHGGDRA